MEKQEESVVAAVSESMARLEQTIADEQREEEERVKAITDQINEQQLALENAEAAAAAKDVEAAEAAKEAAERVVRRGQALKDRTA